jgi:hypothetical protein
MIIADINTIFIFGVAIAAYVIIGILLLILMLIPQFVTKIIDIVIVLLAIDFVHIDILDSNN